MVKDTEKILGYRLPESYISLLKTKNGGTPKNTCFRTKTRTSWAEDHVAISGILGIGGKQGIDSDEFGSQFMIEDWGYPDIGIVICDCPSAGHDAIMLDYSKCGKNGEPQVIHVDVEISDEPTITFLAKDFETFIMGLINEDEFDTSEEDLQEALNIVSNGKFSKMLTEICNNQKLCENIELRIRKICTDIVKSKGFFALHADNLSYLMYDIQFMLFQKSFKVKCLEDYLKVYSKIIALDGEFSTGGYAEGFVVDWFNNRTENGRIQMINDCLQLAPDFEEALIKRIIEY